METSKTILMDFQVDQEAKQIRVKREFDAPRDMVWRAWTEKEILDQWWAPKPWKAVTKSLDFRDGGMWHYYMAGPEGEKHWCRFDYQSVTPQVEFTGHDAFCDEKGKINAQQPRMFWQNRFVVSDGSTLVDITISFDKPEDVKAVVEMGFKEGFTAGLENLDHWLSTQFRLRKENKTTNKARVTTYLNFPGNTEEAMRWYQKVFRGKFVGKGLTRFGDIGLPKDHPPMNEQDMKLIIHAELEILGGYILMATDAPESMGFHLKQGDNMHINVEPDSRKETERLFNELSQGGKVTMPLQDMFFGAYFGSLTDKYGINWMLSYQEKNEDAGKK